MNQLRGVKRPLPFAAMGLIPPRTLDQSQSESVSSDCECNCKRLCSISSRASSLASLDDSVGRDVVDEYVVYGLQAEHGGHQDEHDNLGAGDEQALFHQFPQRYDIPHWYY